MSNITSSVSQNVPKSRQKRMGPAPIASFEDLSDELESPDDKNSAGSVVRLPGIREDATPITPLHQKENENPILILPGISLIGTSHAVSSNKSEKQNQEGNKQNNTMNLQTPLPPRIDVSRASSSSHHDDSRDSTPERELFEGTDQKGTKLGIAFKEEGTLDLRSSTEELDYQDSSEKARIQYRPHSPLAPNDSLQGHQRKDSQSSEIGLLSISGRTSRLSSVGSQCSAQSRISNTSHLSVISGASGRSCSPHKMLLETSFCGNKQPEVPHSNKEEKKDSDELERILLSRKHDPREAILAEGIIIEKKRESSPKKQKEQKKVKPDIKIDKPEIHESNNDSTTPKIPKRIVSASGVEYIYIPLKGPLPDEDSKEGGANTKLREINSATTSRTNVQVKNNDIRKAKSASASPAIQRSTTCSSSRTNKEEPKYIRIKLKPDYMYDDDGTERVSKSQLETEIKKPVYLDIHEMNTKPNAILSAPIQKDVKVELTNCTIKAEAPAKSLLNSTPLSSPGIVRHTNLGSKSPSPSLSRKSSFSLLFKNKESAISPDSPTGVNFKRKNCKSGIFKDPSESTKERRRSRSKSRERDKTGSTSTAPSSTESIDTKSKQKSVISLFKPKKSTSKTKSGTNSPEVTSKSECVAYSKPYYEMPLQGESIRIPLHSPTDSDQKTVVNEAFESSESCSVESKTEQTRNGSSEKITPMEQGKPISKIDKRQSSTSSDNVVFSTKLGSNEEIFSTKLPKDKSTSSSSKSKQTPLDKSKSSISDNTITSSNISKDSVKTVIEKSPQPQETIEIDPFKKSVSLNGDICSNEEIRFSLDEVQTVVVKESVKDPAVASISKLKEEKRTVTEIISLPSQSSSASSTKNDNEQTNNVSTVKTVKTIITNNRVSMISGDEEIYSSESEKDSEVDYMKSKMESGEKSETLESERRGLVFQQDSYEEELPYTPTTLPLERSVALPIVPIKQRGNIEVKTCSIDRPRSTTPINLSCLETFREEAFNSSHGLSIQDIEKIRISLPKELSIGTKPKSPRKPIAPQTISEFSQQIQSSPKNEPPSSTGAIPKETFKEWINFEDIPERRKPPRRIQTIPSKNMEIPDFSVHENVVYTYVNPEDCKCECHETTRERDKKPKKEEDAEKVQEDEVPLLEEELVDEEKSLPEIHDKLKQEIAIADRRSVISDSSVDISTSLEPHDGNCMDQSLRTPFTSDLGISSNRSSVISQEEADTADNPSNDTSRKRPKS
ncbi:uncharacterized protein LOC108737788 isoform X2 [Agrilus planipennis]|uniref:Uncharacterized protein LOC108737788 isoform X2 n=1 Tax=Agrilus planipennis TaxID=224129 RepID=A0A1W4WR52_AGRPL|nr:uncharacterized protein LOC108737788 isoform X2 [Agrilus planipennis]